MSQVAKQAVKTMNSLTTLIQNDDIAPRIPFLVKAIEDPSTQSLQKAIHALSQTTFVAIVTSPVLAMVTPLLERSLNTPTTSQEVTRQTVVVVENLTKLVHDPIEARAFLPKLRPGVKAVKDRASLPEVREIGQRALDVIEKAMADPDHNIDSGAIARVQPSEVQSVIEQQLSATAKVLDFPGDAEVLAVTKRYISEMIAEVVHQRELQRIPKLVEIGRASCRERV